MPDAIVPLSLSGSACSGVLDVGFRGTESWGRCGVVNCGVIIALSYKNPSPLNDDILLKMGVALHPTKHKIIPAAERPLRAPGFSSLKSKGRELGMVGRPLGCHRTFSRAAQDVSVLAHFSPSPFCSRGRVSRAGILHLSSLGVTALSISSPSQKRYWCGSGACALGHGELPKSRGTGCGPQDTRSVLSPFRGGPRCRGGFEQVRR